MAAAHCSSTVGSHSWLRTGAAHVPIFWLTDAAICRRPHSWDWANQAKRWRIVSDCAPQTRHLVSSNVSWLEDGWARKVIVEIFCIAAP